MKIKGIYKRGDIYWFRHMVDGINHRESLETTDLKEALSKAAHLKDIGPVKGDGSIAAIGAKWIAAKQKHQEHRPSSESWAKYSIQNFAAAYPNKTVRQITPEDIQSWLQSERERVAKATANSYLTGIKAFFHWCTEQNIIAVDPAKPVKRPELGKEGAKHTFCSASLRDKIIAQAEDPDLKFILYCGFHAGLRRLEISEARRDWFDLDNKILWVRKSDKRNGRVRPGERAFPIKNGNERPIPLTTPFAEFLRTYLKEDLSPLDFPLKPHIGYGKCKYRYDIEKPFNLHMQAMKCPHVTPHTMRRTFASLLVQRGIPLYKVAKWLGDTEKVTAEHYAHLAPDDQSVDSML